MAGLLISTVSCGHAGLLSLGKVVLLLISGQLASCTTLHGCVSTLLFWVPHLKVLVQAVPQTLTCFLEPSVELQTVVPFEHAECSQDSLSFRHDVNPGIDTSCLDRLFCFQLVHIFRCRMTYVSLLMVPVVLTLAAPQRLWIVCRFLDVFLVSKILRFGSQANMPIQNGPAQTSIFFTCDALCTLQDAEEIFQSLQGKFLAGSTSLPTSDPTLLGPTFVS